MFGIIPAWGFYVRHAKNMQMSNIEIHLLKEDFRPAFQLEDVTGFDVLNLKAEKTTNVPCFVLKNVKDFNVRQSPSIADTHVDEADVKKL